MVKIILNSYFKHYSSKDLKVCSRNSILFHFYRMFAFWYDVYLTNRKKISWLQLNFLFLLFSRRVTIHTYLKSIIKKANDVWDTSKACWEHVPNALRHAFPLFYLSCERKFKDENKQNIPPTDIGYSRLWDHTDRIKVAPWEENAFRLPQHAKSHVKD
jgi:hypothetical protein